MFAVRKNIDSSIVSTSQRGAVSVLVVITMLMLIVFGLLALTSALAFERLGRKAVVWAGEYYELDARATARVQLADECLYFAEIAAREYIAAGDYAKPESVLDATSQAQIALMFGSVNDSAGDDFLNNSTVKQEMISRIFSRLYFFNSAIQLERLAETDAVFSVALQAPFATASDFLTQWSREPAAGDISIKFIESEGDADGAKNLSITLNVVAPKRAFTLAGDSADSVNTVNLRRYDVLEWREWQMELPMQDTPFWDGSFENLPDLPPGLEEFEIDDSLPID